MKKQQIVTAAMATLMILFFSPAIAEAVESPDAQPAMDQIAIKENSITEYDEVATQESIAAKETENPESEELATQEPAPDPVQEVELEEQVAETIPPDSGLDPEVEETEQPAETADEQDIAEELPEISIPSEPIVIEGTENQAADEAEEVQEENFSFSIEWVLNGDELYQGDLIQLQAKREEGFADVRLQWEVAVKPAADLKEDEEEWVGIAGATEDTYQFAVSQEMQGWRWRLCVTLPDDVVVYSDEMTLPKVLEHLDEGEAPQEENQDTDTTMTEESEALDEGVLGAVQALPWAEIAFSANTPDAQITLGTEILLTAQIHDACEGMMLQWQYLAPGTEAWEDIVGAEDTQYITVLDEGNSQWVWRLLITVPQQDLGVEQNESETENEPQTEENAEDEKNADDTVEAEATPDPDSVAVSENEPEATAEIPAS